MTGQAIRVGDTLTNIVNDFTGELETYDKVTTWYDGSILDDIKISKTTPIYRKLGTEYFRRNFDGPIESKWFNLDKTGTIDVSEKITNLVKITDLKLEKNGVYKTKPFTIERNILYGDEGTTLLSDGDIDSTLIECINGGGIEKISLDGQMKSSKGVAIRESGSSNSIKEVKISNFKGVELDSYGIRIYSSTIPKVVTIENVVFTNITAIEDGIVGNLKGAARGIVVGGDKLKTVISSCLFNNVGTFEDGDQIVIATIENPDGSWTYADCIVDKCTFFDVMKRAVKVMASGCTVRDCKAYSNFIDPDRCPQAAFETYSSDTQFLDNTIRFLRGVSGLSFRDTQNITIRGNDIEVDELGIYVASPSRDTLSYAIRGYLTGTTTLMRASGLIESNRINSRSGILLQQTDVMEIKNNRIWGNINISTQCSNINILRNTFYPVKSSNIPLNRVLIAGLDVNNIHVKQNMFISGRVGVKLGSTAFPIANNWYVMDNEYYGMTTSNISNNLTDSTSLFLDLEVPYYNITGTTYSSTSAFNIDNIVDDGIYIVSAQLSNLPSIAGNWWRIEQKSTYKKVTGDDKIQYATMINSPQLDTQPYIYFIRHKKDNIWGSWDRVLTASKTITISADKTTNFIIDNTDDKGAIQYNSTGAGTATIPLNLKIGFTTIIKQKNTGVITFVPASGVTIESVDGLKSKGRGSIIQLYVLNSNVVTLTGNLTI